MKTFIFHEAEHSETEDHILEYLYDKKEKKKPGTLDSLVKLFSGDISADEIEKELAHMQGEGMIQKGPQEISLTAEGAKRAELLVRGHRLAERLMVDVLGLSPDNANKAAHFMEHMVDPEILDAISAFLGHPDATPDGRKIPSGEGKKVLSVRPVLNRLPDLGVGKSGRIRYIQNPERSLSHLGLLPGERVRLVQKRPSVILELGHTTVAIDPSIAADIYVQPDKE